MIAIINDRTLKVQGKAEPMLLEQFLGKYSKKEEVSDWFFIDYSSSDFPLKSKFDFVFSTSNISVLESKATVQIEEVYDSFGHFLEEGIPKGFKTLCRLSFSNNIPDKFKNLPVLSGWKPDSSNLLLTTIEDLKMKVSPSLVDDVLRLAIIQIITPLNGKKINKTEFLSELSNRFNVKEPEQMLQLFTEAGLINNEQNEEEFILN